jgi:copper resistance protein C
MPPLRLRAALAGLALLTPALAPGPALAHAILTESAPKAGDVMGAGETTITLHYNSRIDQARSRVTLSRADGGSEERLALIPEERPDVLQAKAVLVPGAYTLHWFVLATDGHITRGDVPFTVSQ